MNGSHWLWGIGGVAVGYFLLPMLLGMFGKKG